MLFFILHVPGKSKNDHFQSIMTLSEWPVRQTDGLFRAPFPSLCLFLLFSFFSFFFLILIDTSQQKVTKSCLWTSQCNRSIKSGHLQVTSKQMKQLMKRCPGSTYIPTWGQTPSRMPYVPEILETVPDMQHLTPLAVAGRRLESGFITDGPLPPLTAPGPPQGMIAGYQEVPQAAPACSLWPGLDSWVPSFAKKQLFPFPCLSLSQEVEQNPSI